MKTARTVGIPESAEDLAFAALLQEARAAAGLTVREVAERMGVSVSGVSQYLYRRRGKGGTSSLRWFVRYMAACDCAVAVTLPGAERDDRRARTAFAAGGSAGVRGDGAVGGPDRGHELTDEGRLDLALTKHYNELAYVLWTTNYADVTGAAKTKADTCRQAIEAKVAGMAGKESPLARFYHDLLTRYDADGATTQ